MSYNKQIITDIFNILAFSRLISHRARIPGGPEPVKDLLEFSQRVSWSDSFIWDRTPERHDFWEYLNVQLRKNNPKIKSISLKAQKEAINAVILLSPFFTQKPFKNQFSDNVT